MKFAGKVGFWITADETKPGIFKDHMVEKYYTGDVTRAYHKWDSRSEATTDDFSLNNQISILGDLFAQENWPSIKYVLWNGVRWKVKTVGISFPRLTLEVGGPWNGQVPDSE